MICLIMVRDTMSEEMHQHLRIADLFDTGSTRIVWKSRINIHNVLFTMSMLLKPLPACSHKT